jgi:hypothetical protein
MKKHVLHFLLSSAFFFSINSFQAAAQDSPCYILDSIAYAPDSLTAPVSATFLDVSNGWSGIINMGFTFCFFGNQYYRCLIGNNGAISFEVANSNGFHTWAIYQPKPSLSPADLLNTIMLPWQDLYPYQGTIEFQTLGISPNRKFIVKFIDVWMYSCSNMSFSGQAELYETTNVIEIYIKDKMLCPNWNGSLAVEGIQNINGTDAEIVPGRNATQWTATNDAYRFTPVACTCPIGVEELNSVIAKVYPNPTTNTFTIESTSTNPLSKIIIYSTDGRMLKTINIHNSEIINIDVKDFSAGIYFLDCIGQEGRQMVKVVKY